MVKCKCLGCQNEVEKLLPMGLFGKCFYVCKECKDGFRKELGIDSLPYGMKYYFETGVDKYPESNSDNW